MLLSVGSLSPETSASALLIFRPSTSLRLLRRSNEINPRDVLSFVVCGCDGVTINAGTDYTLLVALSEGTTNSVNVVLNGKSVVSYTYNYLVHDGGLGLLARYGAASFDNLLIRGDDPTVKSI